MKIHWPNDATCERNVDAVITFIAAIATTDAIYRGVKLSIHASSCLLSMVILEQSAQVFSAENWSIA